MNLKLFFFAITSYFFCGLQAAQDKFLLRTNASKESTSLPVQALQQKYPQADNKLTKLAPKNIKLKTKKGIKFDAHFYDHGRDQIIILGQGFTGNKKSMDYFVKGFGDSYDMITFDYRWKDLGWYCLNPKTFINPLHQLLHAELDEVKAVVDFVKKRKKYKEVICLGLCYSSFLFLMAQADAEKKGSSLFTKMIIDSCWYSLDRFLDSISKDPMLPARPQAGGTPEVVKTLLHHSPFYRLCFYSAKKCVPKICIKKYVSKVSKPPILFVHGSDDKLVSMKDFDQIWSSCPAQKVGFITPYQHADNFLNEELYTLLCNLFIQSRGIDEFIGRCLSPDQVH